MELIRLKYDGNIYSITDTLPFSVAILDQIYDGDLNLCLEDLGSTKIGKDLETLKSLIVAFEDIVVPEIYAPIEYLEFIEYMNECGLTVKNFARGTFSGFQDKILSIADRGDYESAQKFLDLLMDANVDKATLCELKGNIFLEEGNEEEGIRWLQQALMIDPSLLSAHSFLGQTYYNRGEYDKAAQYWEREISLAPDHLVTYFMLTDAYIQAGRIDEAMNVLRTLSQRDPSSILTKAEMVELCQKAGDFEQARKIEEEILNSRPVYINDIEVWAKTQFRYGRFDTVQEQVLEFLKKEPEKPELKMLLVVTFMKLKNCEEARRLMKSFEKGQLWYFYGKKELFNEFLTEEERRQCGIL
ncbi:MAG TPA: tetratricopeptide repeat protein [Mesotoga infera]|jgi:tetratricopeptide (TPR) repeat protein|uniref:ChAPs (Chs5p-Arf1p-binding proteins) n=1 Tax=Mesotoga infera TaxID=1236046 RepID=A0A7Z7LDY7_9BACT|nr:tetratricopeptide repeat protein [Mesotoga infera]MBP8661332.1 tetratricopeptide repeat protein [Mesotoga sp.]NLI05737.1 tetratricopeptide repeat protein [Thermotogaceae bacterium]SSC11573.1 ChAPs (Chs5p-Arf1p-binding proteins) [Mesotoga infera]HOI35253.1 tetratricopeptide repeat protein [Mesotoga infera]HON27307.1 tetratricopeptide repeat protein [Mesotoga infera]